MKVCPICQGRHDDSTACEVEVTSQSIESRENEPQVPGFRLDHLLSSAHHTETYRARNVATGRPCLIKVVVADEDAAKQAIREAKVAANLFHPSIANFYDCGRLDDGRCFFVFEDVEGKTLRELIDNSGPPDLLDTIEIIREAAEALHALHRSGIVHGSVSPSRIIMSMTAGGQSIVRVTDPDFGRLEQRSIITNRFLIDNELPSLRYFSPEQCSSDEATVQSDVYGLGVVYYEMLAGFPPFEASTAVGLIQQHMSQPPPDIRIANFNLRMLVTYALNEALQKQTRLRQPSINTLARQLRHIEQLATHSSTPPPAGTAITQTVVTPAMPAAASIDSHPQTLEQPKILSEVEVLEAELEAVTIVTTVAAPRRRVVSIEDALEESDSYITNLEAPPPHRPSLMQTWKEKLHAVTAMFTIERSGGPEEEPVDTDAIDDVPMVATSGARDPKKIEWVQPDDDIPSIDAVREVLATDYDMPLAVSAVESEVEPIVMVARAPEIETVRPAPKKIEWAQPDDDIPSIDAVQEVLAFEREISLAVPAVEMSEIIDPEPQIIYVEPVTVEPEVIAVEAAPAELEVTYVEPVPVELEVIAVEAAPAEIESAMQELVVEPSEPEVILVESAQPEPEAILVESAQPEPGVIVEPPQIEPKVIHFEPVPPLAPALVAIPALRPESLKDFAVDAVRKRRKKKREQPVEIIVEPQQAEQEAMHADSVEEPLQFVESATSEPQELVVEPPQPEPEVIHVESAISGLQELVVEPPQPEPEVIQVESAISEPQQVVVEPLTADPEVMLVESVESEPVVEPEPVLVEAEPIHEIVAAPKVVQPVKQSAVAAVRKRHKKLLRRQPVKLVAAPQPEPQDLAIEAPQLEAQVIHVEPVNSQPQEIIVEPQPDVVQVEGAEPEPEELILVLSRPEPQLIHVEPAASEPQKIVVEPAVLQAEPSTPETESVEPEPVPTAPAIVPVAKPTVLAFVPKRNKKSSRRQPIAVAAPFSTDDEEITIVRPRKKSKRVRIHVSMPPPKPPRTTVPAEPEFFPTLLGGAIEPTGFTSEQSDGMFAGYSAETSHPIAQYRAHLIGAGIIALLALFLYGSDFLTGYLLSSDSMTAEAIRPAGSNRPPASTTKPIVAKPAIDDDTQVSEKRIVEKKDRTTVQKTKAPVSPDTGTAIPHDSLMKAMIVLPPRAAQVEAMSQSDAAEPKRSADKVVPGQNETRQRVVKDPSP